MIKCAHGCNQHGVRNVKVINNKIEDKCPRCNQIEMWEHAMQCCETKELWREFAKDLVAEWIKHEPGDISDERITSFIEDIVMHLENDKEEEYGTNQCLAGMQELLRGCAVIDWERAGLNSKRHRLLNTIVVKKCVEFYVKY